MPKNVDYEREIKRDHMMNMLKLDWTGWAYGLFGAVIGGGSGAVTTWLGMIVAKQVGIDVPALNWNAIGVVFLTSGAVSFFAYLKQSPLPPKEPETKP